MLTHEQVEELLKRHEEVNKDPTRFKDYADYPVEFARDILGLRRQPNQPPEYFPNDCSLWVKQQEILTAPIKNRRVACRSGNTTGKSFALGVLTIFWHLARQGRVISTGPTRTHIEDVLWPQIHELFHASLVPLPGQLDKTHWKQNDAGWYATGVTTDKENAFAGRHHPNLLVIIDEASGVADTIHQQAATCAAAISNRIVMVGNPTTTSGRFYEAFKRPEVWYPIHISCFDHPNVLLGAEVVQGATSREWIEEQRGDYGEKHPWWDISVKGEFPQLSERAVIPLAWLERSKDDRRHEEAIMKAKANGIPLVAGLDIGGPGNAKSVLVFRRGDAIEDVVWWERAKTTETVGRAIGMCRERNVSDLVFDRSGLGVPVGDMFSLLKGLPFHVHAHIGGARAFRQRVYSNRRTESWMHLRHRLEMERFWLPSRAHWLPQLTADLLAPELNPTQPSGRIAMEPKEKMIERGVRSPDFGDALTMSFCVEPDPESELEVPLAPFQDPEAHRSSRAFVVQEEDTSFDQLPGLW